MNHSTRRLSSKCFLSFFKEGPDEDPVCSVPAQDLSKSTFNFTHKLSLNIPQVYLNISLPSAAAKWGPDEDPVCSVPAQDLSKSTFNFTHKLSLNIPKAYLNISLPSAAAFLPFRSTSRAGIDRHAS